MGWVTSTFASPFAPQPGPVAIEFRGHRARLLQIASQRSGAVVAAASIPFDPDHPERSADALVDCLRSGGFRSDSCVIGLPLAAVRAETMTVPDGPNELIVRQIERSAPLRYGFARPQCGLLRLGSPTSAGVEVAAVIADRLAVEAILDPLVDRGILPDAAEPSFVSVARSCSRTCRRQSDAHRVRLAVDLHEEGATAMLLAGDRIVWCRCVDDRIEVPGAVATCLHDGAPHVSEQPSEIRLVGIGADDPQLIDELSDACGIRIAADDERGTFTQAFRQIGVRAEPGASAADWGGVLGLAFRGPLRQSTSQHDRKEAA